MNTNLPPKDPFNRKIRVLITDDSPLIRDILFHMLNDAEDIGVVGQAEDGADAVRMAARLSPDVITMDIRMPRMDGLEAIRQIMQKTPMPIIVVANGIHDSDFNISFKAIEAGALTVVEKPRGLTTKEYQTIQNRLIAAVRMVANLKVVARWPSAKPSSSSRALPHTLQNRIIQIVAIAASTGGPGVLKQILGQLPEDYSFPIVVVQHITSGFSEHMVSWLNGEVKINVATAKNGDRIQAGKVFVAPSDHHLTITPGGVIRLDEGLPIRGQRPSADRFFASVAQTYNSSAIGIILTGMGDDGADGIEVLGKTGAHIIAQNEQSSVVFGMPAQAIQRGVVDEVLSPDEIAETLISLHNAAINLRRSVISSLPKI
jgi:two-component system chemotaxis response regulator CheB